MQYYNISFIRHSFTFSMQWAIRAENMRGYLSCLRDCYVRHPRVHASASCIRLWFGHLHQYSPALVGVLLQIFLK